MNEIETITVSRPSVPPPTHDQWETARHLLLQAIEEQERRLHQGRPEHVYQQPRRRAAIVSVAAFAVALVVLISVVGLGPASTPLGPDAAAAAALSDAAEAVSHTQTTIAPGPILDTNEYVHTTSEGVYLYVAAAEDGLFAALVPFHREVWIAADGSGRIRVTEGEPEFLSEQDRATWQEAGRPRIALSRDQSVGPGGFVVNDLAALSNDPDDLKRYLTNELAGSAKPIEAALFDRIRELLSESDLAPRLKAALYQVAATIDGIELLDDVADRAGRTGVAVGLTYVHSGVERRSVLLFDPATAELLGTESIILSESPDIRAPLPATIGYVTYETPEIVDHIPDK